MSETEDKFRIQFLAPHYWPIWAGLGLLWTLSRLPYRAQLWLGAGLGRIAYALAGSRRRVAATNLRLCLPEMEPQRRDAVLKQHFEALGISLLEMGMTWWTGDRKLRALTRIDGMENLQQALAKGKGVILLGGHFTPMEIALRLLAVHLEPRIHPVYQIHSDPFMERTITGNRQRHSGKAIPSDNIREMVRVLRRNGIVWYAPDQAYKDKGSEMVPFFGVPACSHTATSRLAKLAGAAVVPFFTRRLPGNEGYQLTLHPPLEDFPSDDPVADTLRYHQLIEHHARLAPEQYLWIHRRFKGRPAAYPDVYRRDLTFEEN